MFEMNSIKNYSAEQVTLPMIKPQSDTRSSSISYVIKMSRVTGFVSAGFFLAGLTMSAHCLITNTDDCEEHSSFIYATEGLIIGGCMAFSLSMVTHVLATAIKNVRHHYKPSA